MIIQYTVLNCSSFIIHHSYSPLALFYSYNLVHARCWTGLNQTKSLTLEDHIIVSIKSIYEMRGTRSATHDKASNLWYQCNGAVLLMISDSNTVLDVDLEMLETGWCTHLKINGYYRCVRVVWQFQLLKYIIWGCVCCRKQIRSSLSLERALRHSVPRSCPWYELNANYEDSGRKRKSLVFVEN